MRGYLSAVNPAGSASVFGRAVDCLSAIVADIPALACAGRYDNKIRNVVKILTSHSWFCNIFVITCLWLYNIAFIIILDIGILQSISVIAGKCVVMSTLQASRGGISLLKMNLWTKP